MNKLMNEKEKAELQAEGIKNITENFRCCITVLRKVFNEDLYDQYPYGYASPCSRFEVGQVFITENRWDPPEGFCPWAWSDLRPMIQGCHAGNEVISIACCTDGLRPVTFKLECIPAMSND
jgi:uncharacterized repeat protein (TIGR04076 family)